MTDETMVHGFGGFDSATMTVDDRMGRMTERRVERMVLISYRDDL